MFLTAWASNVIPQIPMPVANSDGRNGWEGKDTEVEKVFQDEYDMLYTVRYMIQKDVIYYTIYECNIIYSNI